MSEFESSQEVVDLAAKSCAHLLAKWFGGVEEAIKALEEDPASLADLALRSHMKTQRDITVKAHMNIGVVSRSVLEMIR